MRVAPGCLLQGADEVQTPHSKRPGDGYGLQSLSRQVGLPCVELTPFAGADNSSGVSYRRWPVEALPESISNEEACFLQQFPTFGDGDASLEDARGAAMVELLFVAQQDE